MTSQVAFTINRQLAASLLSVLLVPGWQSAYGVTTRDAESLFRSGRYTECAQVATQEVEKGIRLEAWRHIRIDAYLALGQYAEAMDAVHEALKSYPRSIRLRLLAYHVYRFNNRQALADSQLATFEQFVRRNPQRYTSTSDRIALGRYFLERGVDARQVLELFLDPAVKASPDSAEAHLTRVRLAIDKYDNGLAAELLSEIPDPVHDDPEFHFLTARAYANDDASKVTAALNAALKLNPHHINSLLFLAEQQIDREHYDSADQTLESAHQVNPRHPIAWSLQAVLANLRGDQQGEADATLQALRSWPQNPHVEHTIGRKLSDKYRFAEAAEYQRRALAKDASYLPARMQLGQDLLRLGQEEEGWQIVRDVFAADNYNVVAHNLVTLHDAYKKYRVIRSDNFHLRMESREAAIYASRVMELLGRARHALCEKYDLELHRPVTVEIFPNQQDFAVRTFGLPGADGFLGVCFGNVITANSPAALGQTRANWESVLWHEFCHVVTLSKSRNKMPRWLSEGISVYEERQANPAWGPAMSPDFRSMILDGDMVPMSELSSAFLVPESPQHLQFAYYQSSLAVEYIIDNYGLESIRKVLSDLADGESIHAALARHVAPMSRLDEAFHTAITERAQGTASELTWQPCDAPADANSQTLAAWLEHHPQNFFGRTRWTQALLREQKWQPAVAAAEDLRAFYPEYVGPDNSYELLAQAHRGLSAQAAEREVLEAWAARSGDAVAAYTRLIEIAEQHGDWDAVSRNARRMLAVNPLSPVPYRPLARAAEQLALPEEAIAAYRALLNFDTTDPVMLHFRMAQQLVAADRGYEAKRAVLKALEQAPRFRQAHQLLWKLTENSE